ncbi:MAG: hypothetical protein LUE98_18920 [Tannerellaceae bacterium]|nr:hypothetical protein [Tannerellaceae bacterium]
MSNLTSFIPPINLIVEQDNDSIQMHERAKNAIETINAYLKQIVKDKIILFITPCLFGLILKVPG